MGVRKFFRLSCGLMLIVTSVCGCGDFVVSPTHGRVTFNGNPVSTGEVTFVCHSVPGEDEGYTGKLGKASIAEDGTYTLTTYKINDGAIIGTHDVKVSKADWPGRGKAEAKLNKVLAALNVEIDTRNKEYNQALVSRARKEEHKPIGELKKQLTALSEKRAELNAQVPLYDDSSPIMEVQIVKGENTIDIEITDQKKNQSDED